MHLATYLHNLGLAIPALMNVYLERHNSVSVETHKRVDALVSRTQQQFFHKSTSPVDFLYLTHLATQYTVKSTLYQIPPLGIWLGSDYQAEHGEILVSNIGADASLQWLSDHSLTTRRPEALGQISSHWVFSDIAHPLASQSLLRPDEVTKEIDPHVGLSPELFCLYADIASYV